MKIAISGKSGCGNTTVSRLLAEKLGYTFINYTFRSLAQEKGIDFVEILRIAEQDPSLDRELDAKQVELASVANDCVVGSRLAIWLIEDADLKVYLQASQKVRIERISKRERKSLEQTTQFTIERDAHDHHRYLKLYGIDNDNYEFADLVLNTDHMSPEQLTNRIIEAVAKERESRKTNLYDNDKTDK